MAGAGLFFDHGFFGLNGLLALIGFGGRFAQNLSKIFLLAQDFFFATDLSD